MQIEDVKALIEQEIPGAEVVVTGEGCNVQVTVISAAFVDKSRIQQQRMVYAPLNDKIASGELHAVSIKSYTPEQWADMQ